LCSHKIYLECADNGGALDLRVRPNSKSKAPSPFRPDGALQTAVWKLFGKFLVALKIFRAACADNALHSKQIFQGEFVEGTSNGLDFSKGEQAAQRFFDNPMRRKKKTTIVTIESRERTTIHRVTRRMAFWCERCGADALMVTPSEAATFCSTDTRAIFRGVETGEIHCIEMDGGALLVCSNSLRLPQAPSW
jgi:hypothetical protein